MRQPLPGDIGLTKVKGPVGWLIHGLQWLNGDFGPAEHVYVVLDDDTVFEAQPGGAVITPLSEYDDRWHEYVDYDLTWDQRARIVSRARTYVGIGYNWTTYFYLAAHRLHFRPKWLKRRLENEKRLICSQAADKIWRDEGIDLFPDKEDFDITPADFCTLKTWKP